MKVQAKLIKEKRVITLLIGSVSMIFINDHIFKKMITLIATDEFVHQEVDALTRLSHGALV